MEGQRVYRGREGQSAIMERTKGQVFEAFPECGREGKVDQIVERYRMHQLGQRQLYLW
jgi:hypothetical protein